MAYSERATEGLYVRLMRRTERKDNGCLEWTGSCRTDGYGQITGGRRGEPLLATHRASYFVHKGEIPEGKWVLHHCDNRRCIEPRHLYLGDHAQNMQDAKDRNRFKPTRKVSSKRVNSIRSETGMTQQQIADKYGITQSQVSRILNHKQWK